MPTPGSPVRVWTRPLAALPDRLQDALRFVYVAARVTCDLQSLLTFGRLARQRDRDDPRSPARLRLRPLGGREVLVRPGTSDADTVWGTFARGYHLPPPEVGTPRTIWDLGANIGLTMAHFACVFPGSRVIGVELDAENAALAHHNNPVEWLDPKRHAVEDHFLVETEPDVAELDDTRSRGAHVGKKTV